MPKGVSTIPSFLEIKYSEIHILYQEAIQLSKKKEELSSDIWGNQAQIQDVVHSQIELVDRARKETAILYKRLKMASKRFPHFSKNAKPMIVFLRKLPKPLKKARSLLKHEHADYKRFSPEENRITADIIKLFARHLESSIAIPEEYEHYVQGKISTSFTILLWILFLSIIAASQGWVLKKKLDAKASPKPATQVVPVEKPMEAHPQQAQVKPPVVKQVTPLPKQNTSVLSNRVFRDAVRCAVDDLEGGVSDHPQDSGGLTNNGVTHETYDDYRKRKGLPLRSVENIEEREVYEIYSTFWKLGKCDRIGNSKLQIAHFCAVINNPKAANRLLQRCLNYSGYSVNVDSKLGNLTFSTLNRALQDGKGDILLANYFVAQERRYKWLSIQYPKKKGFFDGWIDRIRKTKLFIRKNYR